MSFNVKKLAKPSHVATRTRIAEGTYPARLVQLISIGIQESEWQGEKKTSPKVILTFELPTETILLNGEEQPKWLSKEQKKAIKEVYVMAKELETVFPWSQCVDHIVPLRGEKVCGLHVPWNLQVIPLVENRKKRNILT
jgi:hypothetical protein